MYTLYGPEAKNGDFVLIQDVAYMKGSADIIIAKVHNGKAYSAASVQHKYINRRWLRKETAIIKIDASEVPEVAKQLIDMNINSEKSTFDRTSDYGKSVWTLEMELYRIQSAERESRSQTAEQELADMEETTKASPRILLIPAAERSKHRCSCCGADQSVKYQRSDDPNMYYCNICALRFIDGKK